MINKNSFCFAKIVFSLQNNLTKTKSSYGNQIALGIAAKSPQPDEGSARTCSE